MTARLMFSPRTGGRAASVRPGYSDADAFGLGLVCAASGNLDAPDHIPQGSVRVHNTIRLNPQLSLRHRDCDTGHLPVGAGSDGPEPVPGTLYLHGGAHG